jgi:WXG100 family type VII secretion target
MGADAGAIDDVAGELQRATARVSEALAVFDDHTATLRAGWSGEAADAYDRARTEWRASIDTANAVLQEGSALMATAAEAFATAEASNTARW